MTLAELVGTHVVSGRFETVGDELTGSGFGLLVDGGLLLFQEDASDSYRSMLGDIERLEATPSGATLVQFRPIPMVFTLVDDILRGVDLSGHKWFEVGTDSTDNYYPMFVGIWSPREEGVVRPGGAVASPPGAR